MTQDPNIGRLLEGKYKLIRVLGTGGMGTVYEATHLLIKRRLAVKLLHAEYAREALFATRFKREAQTASAIGHDHIVDITDMGTTDTGELFIVMEYLEGADLATLLQQEPLVSPQLACHIMIQVLSALEAAHAKGIVHRDLKPANIFIIHHIDSDYYVKLVDFGISKRRQNDADMTRGLTRTGELLGTPSFMSPEQARGEGSIDAKSDIFSAGMILYKLLTGNVPFEDKALTMLLLKILNETPPHPCDVNPHIPKSLGDTVLKAMEKEPQNRFKDAASFRRVLQRYSPDTASKTGLRVTQYSSEVRMSVSREGTDPVLEATPFQLVVSDNTPPKKKRRVIGMVVAALLVGLIAVGAFYSQTQSRVKAGARAVPVQPQPSVPENAPPTAPEVAEPVESTPVAPKVVEITVTASPKEAAVLIDGKKVGVGNAKHRVRRDNEKHELSVTATGYQPYTNTISFSYDFAYDIKLAKEVEPSSASDTRRERRRERRQAASAPVDSTADESAKGNDATASAATPGVPGASNDDGEPASPEGTPDQPSGRPLRVIDEVNPW